VTAVIGGSAAAPVMAEPSLRSEQVSQLLLGETGEVLATEAAWLRVRCTLDGYEGWIHRGYVVECAATAAEQWRADADGWSEGAVVETPTGRRRLPLRARAALEHGRVRLPDGSAGPLVDGRIQPSAEVRRAAREVSAEQWAAHAFSGVPYHWGGVTDLGVDCSGLVQTTFAARGIALPRDSSAQAEVGERVSPDAARPGDLLFFSENGRSVTHVAILAAGDRLVHSTVACGGVIVEPWSAGHRAAALRAQCTGARRLPGTAAG